MRLLKRLSLALALSIAGAVAHAATLPEAVVAKIKRDLPTYRVSSDANHMVTGDFDANGLPDIAALLSGSGDWQLVVFRQFNSTRYSSDVIDQFPGSDREFKSQFGPEVLSLHVVAQGEPLDVNGTVINDVAEQADTLVLLMPASEQKVMTFRWSRSRAAFGASQISLGNAVESTRCAYDPASGVPNAFGTRAFVTIERREGDAVFVYEQFPELIAGVQPATLSTRRELVFPQTSIDAARALVREQASYYEALTGDDDPAGFSFIENGLVCR